MRWWTILLLPLLLVACRPPAGQQSNAPEPAQDRLLDFEQCKQFAPHKNNLSAIPFTDMRDELPPRKVLDSAELVFVYQDSINHYFPVEAGAHGNQYYGYIDTFVGFNLVCMYAGQGDGGDIYELLTYTKQGKRIAYLPVAYLQGEEDEWEYAERASVMGSHIRLSATLCHGLDSAKTACDTLRYEYLLTAAGRIIPAKSDTLLDPQLDSIRRVRPY
jgi:hypothetical protein